MTVMANQMINEVQRATSVSSEDLILVDQADGTTRAVRVAELAAYFK